MQSTLNSIGQRIKTENDQNIHLNHMLAVTLSTLVQIAKKATLENEYYVWTKTYLEVIKNENPKMQNVLPFMRHIDWFKKTNCVEEGENFHITPIVTYVFPTNKNPPYDPKEPCSDY